ncbi:hypothetical protein G5B47_07010 [Paenibacillus sp. 7124]|uniref:Uncharacterized protein n=1 Tax=Paenibacillus apii TaxID=1850370 RepID=A0A6M1PFE9_9BACL|nr:hypothetical protein [Paenibacillus apii]NGM82159.1 hypothetical protein [Paenibacillus apii]
MQNNLFTKFCLLGILICLVVIAFKPHQIIIPSTTTNPSSTIIRNDFIQIAPNIIGVRDDGSGTGIADQLLVFEFDSVSKTFKYSGTALDVQDYLTHPEKYGVPNNKTQ